MHRPSIKLKRFKFQSYSILFLSLNLFFFNNCTGGFIADNGSSFGSVNSESSFQCKNTNDASLSGSHFLSKKQYSNTIEDLFGTAILNQVSSTLSTIPSDTFNEEFRQKTTTLDPNTIQAYYNSAIQISSAVVNNTTSRNSVFGSCSGSATILQSCIDGFINNFSIRILRRPLKSDEITFINSFFSGPGTNNEKLQASLNFLLQSPFFILRLELGGDTDVSPDLNLTDYEAATRLSYALTDTTPDLTLLTAVKNGQFKTDEEIRAQAERLITTSRGKAKTQDIILHWSLSENTQDLSSLPADLTVGINMSGLEAAMVDEARKFIDHIVFNTDGTFQDLLKSKLSFASHTGLAKIYNHNPVVGGVPELITERRQGLLMRAPFFSWGGPRTNIIKRGVEFQKRVLCNNIPSPNVNIADDRDSDAFTPEEQMENSNRINITHQTRGPVCMSCHSAINPVGFAFESFDSLGKLRNKEYVFDLSKNFYKFTDIDTKTSISRYRANSYPIQDAVDLVEYVAESTEGNECFIRNVSRYLNEAPETDKDNCNLSKAFKLQVTQGSSIKNVIVELAINNNLKRKFSN